MPSIAESLRKGTPGILGALEMFKENRRREEEEQAMEAVRSAAEKIYGKMRPRVESRPDNSQDADALVLPPSVAGATSPPMGERSSRTPGVVSRMQPAGMIPIGKIPMENVTVPGEGAGFEDIMNLFSGAGKSEQAMGLAQRVAQAAEAERRMKAPNYSIMNQEGGGYDVFEQVFGKAPRRVSGRAGVVKPQAAAMTPYQEETLKLRREEHEQSKRRDRTSRPTAEWVKTKEGKILKRVAVEGDRPYKTDGKSGAQKLKLLASYEKKEAERNRLQTAIDNSYLMDARGKKVKLDETGKAILQNQVAQIDSAIEDINLQLSEADDDAGSTTDNERIPDYVPGTGLVYPE